MVNLKLGFDYESSYVKSEFLQEVRDSTGIGYFVAGTGVNDHADCAELPESLFRCDTQAIREGGHLCTGPGRRCVRVLDIFRVRQRVSERRQESYYFL